MLMTWKPVTWNWFHFQQRFVIMCLFLVSLQMTALALYILIGYLCPLEKYEQKPFVTII